MAPPNESSDDDFDFKKKKEQRPVKPLYAPDYDKKTDLDTVSRKRWRRGLGLDPSKPLKPHEAGSEKFFWCRIRTMFQEPFSEFLGTLILACFHAGSIAQATVGATLDTAPGAFGYGSFHSVPWGTGIGVMLGIYVGGDSGAYLNPAITFANCMFRGLPWRQFPITIFAQFLGAFIGSGMVYGHYVGAIDWYSGYGVRAVPPAAKATASILATFPQIFTNRATQAIGILLPTTLMTMVISALKDDYNNGVSKAGGNFFPLSMFFLFYGLSTAFGFTSSGVTNPALDFSGRVMLSAVGYPSTVWSGAGYFFWMPLILPFIGATFGAFLYDAFVYTGPSPINARWLGFGKLFDPGEQERNKEDREEHRDDDSNDAV